MVILYAVGGRALLTGMRSVAGAGKDMVQATQIAAIGQLVLTLFIGLAASIYVAASPGARAARVGGIADGRGGRRCAGRRRHASRGGGG